MFGTVTPEYLKELREGADLSQQEMALEFDVSRSLVSAWELGTSPMPDYIDEETVREAITNAAERRVGYHESRAKDARETANRFRKADAG